MSSGGLTVGLSSHVIRISELMQEVYEEIRQDIQVGVTLFADETGPETPHKNGQAFVD